MRGLVDDLLAGEPTDAEGVSRPLTLEDVLVVAPYNAHVAVSARPCPRARGSAPSTSSRASKAPSSSTRWRQHERLGAPRGSPSSTTCTASTSPVSRAKAMAVVVASPQLLDAEVHTPEDLRAVNALSATSTRRSPSEGQAPWAATSQRRPSPRMSGRALRIDARRAGGDPQVDGIPQGDGGSPLRPAAAVQQDPLALGPELAQGGGGVVEDEVEVRLLSSSSSSLIQNSMWSRAVIPSAGMSRSPSEHSDTTAWTSSSPPAEVGDGAEDDVGVDRVRHAQRRDGRVGHRVHGRPLPVHPPTGIRRDGKLDQLVRSVAGPSVDHPRHWVGTAEAP